MERTNSKKYTENMRQYLSGCMEGDFKTGLANVFKCFASEFDYEYNRRRWPNNQERLAHYLQGLPSCINIDFSNHSILEVAARLHGVDGFDERMENKILENWFSHVALFLIRFKSEKGSNQ